MNVNASELIHTDIDKEIEMKIEDPYSENILQKGLFLEDKVQMCKNRSECMAATRLLIAEYSTKMKEDKLFVDNCVIVNSLQEIAFDTRKVISSIHYDDMYYIQYETVTDAKEALEVFKQYPSVVYAVTDDVITAESMNLDSVAKAASPLIGKDGYTHHSWGITQTGLDIFAEHVSNHSSGLVKIAVVDTGVYSSHPFLQGHISNARYGSGCNKW